MEIIERVSVIDFLMGVLFLRVVYTAVSRGVVNEIFKTTGLLIGFLLAFHYYPLLSAKAGVNLSFWDGKYLPFISFLLLLLGVLTVFSLLRKIISFLWKREDIPVKERWLSFVIAAVRFAVLSSVLLFGLYLYSLDEKYYSRSAAYLAFKNVAPKAYLISVDAINFYKGDSFCIVNKEVKEYYQNLRREGK